MTALKNDTFIRACRREATPYTPVWVMRQAGRYLPEYRELRQQAGNFMTLCQTPELACAATLQPLARYDLDASIIFSDILTIPDAMGLGLYFSTGEGPRFERPITDVAMIEQLPIPDPEADLGYVMDAIRMVHQELDQRIPLIGFAGSPWTLATYMIEGGSSKTFAQIKRMLYTEPAALSALLRKLSQSIQLYLKAQVAAGAQALMIFDSWGGVLSPATYRDFSLEPMKAIVAALKADPATKDIPIILFTKQAGSQLAEMADTGCDVLGVDWTVDLATAREWVDGKVALQGNLDPAIMLSSPEIITQEVAKVLNSFGEGPGHIFNLGHGITPDVPPEHMKVLVDTVHDLTRG